MTPRFRLLCGVSACFLLHAGCTHRVVTQVDLYHPKVRLAELKHEQSQTTGSRSAPLSAEEARVLAMLEGYMAEHPAPLRQDAYPVADYIRLGDNLRAHHDLVAPLRRRLSDAFDAELDALRARHSTAKVRHANLRAEYDWPREPGSAAKTPTAEPGELSAAAKAEAGLRAQLEDLAKRKEETTAAFTRALDADIAAAAQALAEARGQYVSATARLPLPRVKGPDPDAPKRREAEAVYAAAVHETVRSFVLAFWQKALAPDLASARTSWLDTPVELPPGLDGVYAPDSVRETRLAQIAPAGLEGSRREGPSLENVIQKLAPAPVLPPPPSETYEPFVTDPIIAIAQRDTAGWQATPSFISHKSGSKSDFLIVRESLARYTAVAIRDTPSTTVDASMRLAVATTAIVVEVAQTLAGVNLGISAPPGGIDNPDDPNEVRQALRDTSPWTAATLRAIARARFDRAQTLLQNVPAPDTAERAKWEADVRGLLASHPKTDGSAPTPAPATAPAE